MLCLDQACKEGVKIYTLLLWHHLVQQKMPVGDNKKMTSLLFRIGDAVMNALAFTSTNFVFSELMGYSEKKKIWKSHDLAL